MDHKEITKVLGELEKTKDRNLVIVDYGNVQKWEKSLGWKIGIKELGTLVKNISSGKGFLRRFYYGSDFGRDDKSQKLIDWSRMILDKAKISGFDVCTKRVKYIHDPNNKFGFQKKCDLDVEMVVDMIKEIGFYDTVVLFSGDGDLACVIQYLFETYKKQSIIFAARDHLGKELVTLKEKETVKQILFADDFEYRLDRNRFMR